MDKLLIEERGDDRRKGTNEQVLERQLRFCHSGLISEGGLTKTIASIEVKAKENGDGSQQC